MREFAKISCVLVLMVGAVAGPLAWTENRPNTITWGFRIGGPTLAILAIGVFLKLHFRADLAHDYLRDHAGTYFNRDGFGFAFVATAVDGVAYMDVYFQNQRDKPCVGRIALRPARGFFLTRAKIETITYEIECAPAAFGHARLAIPIPEKLQGKRQSFEVGASVDYPKGKGKQLRFHDGVTLRANTDFGNAFHTGLTIAAAATGMIFLSKPVTAKVDLPAGVAEDISDNLVPEIKTLWRLGDPPLDATPVGVPAPSDAIAAGEPPPRPKKDARKWSDR